MHVKNAYHLSYFISNMGKIGFRIRSKSNRQVAIYVYLYGPQRMRLEAKTGFIVLNADWDQKTMRSKIIDESSIVLNNKLDELERHLIHRYNSINNRTIDFTRVWLESEIDRCFKRPVLLNTAELNYHIQQYIETADMRRVRSTGSIGLSYNTIRSYCLFQKIIKEFQEYSGSIIYLETIDKSMVDRLTQWLLKTKKYSVNNAGHQLKQLKTICKEAERNGYKTNPFVTHIESFKRRSSERLIHTFNFNEISTLKKLKGLNIQQDNARKWMLIGCFIGQRVSDLLAIKPTQIRKAKHGLYLDILQKKTNKHVTIGIGDLDVVHILESEFPYAISAIEFNRLIKEVSKVAGFTEQRQGYKQNPNTRRKEMGIFPKYELMCAHDLRRSFATNYFGKVETPILMSITGHSKESTFLHYIGVNPNKDAIADVFMERSMAV